MNDGQNEALNNTVVLAEDSPTNRTVIQHLLVKLGFEVEVFSNGLEAWEFIEKNMSEQIIAVISDIMMPELDGIELLRRVRGTEKISNLPFVLVTAVMEKDQILEAKQLKVDGYILKPVTFQRVSIKLKEILPNHKFPRKFA